MSAGTLPGIPALAVNRFSELTEELKQHLAEAATQFDQSADDDQRRDAALQQLMRITLYLQRLGIQGDILRPTTMLVHAVVDIDRGGAHPKILVRTRKSADQRISQHHLAQRGLAAAAVTLFVAAEKDNGSEDQKLDRALRKVASRIRKWSAVSQRSAKQMGPTSLVEPLRDWRNAAMDRRSNGIDHVLYLRALEIRAETSHSPGRWAEWILTEGVKPYR